MSSAMRVGVQRVAAAAARPAQIRRAMSNGTPPRVIENQQRFQQNPHLHGETPTPLLRQQI